MNLPGPALNHVFLEGASVVTADGESHPARIIEMGYLTLPTGKIVVCDPLLDPWNEPFTKQVSPGSYPVFGVAIQNELSLVRVLVEENPPVEWRKTKPATFNVDSATACLMDVKVHRLLRRKADRDQYDRYMERFRDALDSSDEQWVSYRRLPDPMEANLVLFQTRGGDGTFSCYFGYSAERTLACLVIDMYLDQEHILEVR